MLLSELQPNSLISHDFSFKLLEIWELASKWSFKLVIKVFWYLLQKYLLICISPQYSSEMIFLEYMSHLVTLRELQLGQMGFKQPIIPFSSI